MINGIKIEVCAGSVDDCIIADRCNADRIELNLALEMGGLTCSVGNLVRAKKHTDIPICCMVRPRGFGFDYSDEEFEVMKYDARLLLENGADGIVFGILHADGTIDEQRTSEMVELIHPKEAIFHKAFDSTPDLEASIQTLIRCGIDRILTSGGAVYPNMEEGIKKLADLQKKYGNQIEILPGGGVRAHNALEILKETRCTQIHMTAKHYKVDESTLHYPTKQTAEKGSYVATSEKNLKQIIAEIAKL